MTIAGTTSAMVQLRANATRIVTAKVQAATYDCWWSSEAATELYVLIGSPVNVPGATVSFVLTNGASSSAQFSHPTGVTDANGEARSMFVNGSGGSCQITVNASGIDPVSQTAFTVSQELLSIYTAANSPSFKYPHFELWPNGATAAARWPSSTSSDPLRWPSNSVVAPIHDNFGSALMRRDIQGDSRDIGFEWLPGRGGWGSGSFLGGTPDVEPVMVFPGNTTSWIACPLTTNQQPAAALTFAFLSATTQVSGAPVLSGPVATFRTGSYSTVPGTPSTNLGAATVSSLAFENGNLVWRDGTTVRLSIPNATNGWLGEWNSWVVTKAPPVAGTSVTRIYLNGQLAGEFTQGTPVPAAGTASSITTLLLARNETTGRFRGKLDDVGLFNYALSPADIESRHFWQIGRDSDTDGLPDVWEKQHFIDTRLAQDITEVFRDQDYDCDGLSNHQEYIQGTNPAGAEILVDPDGDRIPTLWERQKGTDPLIASDPQYDATVDASLPASNASLKLYRTLQEAYNAAPPDYSIILVKPGTYAAALTMPTTGTVPPKRIAWIADNMTDEVVVNPNGIAVTLSDITSLDGFIFQRASSTHTGTAVNILPHASLDSVSPVIRIVNCVFHNRRTAAASSAAGLVNNGAQLTLAHCTFTANATTYTGAAPRGHAVLTLQGSTAFVNCALGAQASPTTANLNVVAASAATVTASNSFLVGMNGAWGSLPTDPGFVNGWHLTASSAARSQGANGVALHDIYGAQRSRSGTPPDLGAEQWLSDRPAPPLRFVAASVTPTSVQLNWDLAPEAHGYIIERRAPHGSGAASAFQRLTSTPLAANVSSFLSQGLTANTYYVYRIAAIHPQRPDPDPSLFSDEWTHLQVDTPWLQPTAPTTPTVASITDQACSVSWTGGTNMESFLVEISSDNGATWRTAATVPSNVRTAAIADLIQQTNYLVRVAAVNPDGRAVSANRAFLTLPAAPQNLRITAVTDSTATLAWTNMATTRTGFRIQRKLPSATTWTAVPDQTSQATSFVVTGLLPATAYDFRVATLNGTVQSAFSAPVLLPAQLPPPPTNLTASPTLTSVSLSWQLPADPNRIGVRIRRTLNGISTQIAELGSSATSFSDENLVPSTTYSYQVVCVNFRGESSASLQVTTLAPPAPSLLTITAATPSSVMLSWQDNSPSETGFRIEQSSNGNNWIALPPLDPNVTSHGISSLDPALPYRFRVSSLMASAASVPSNEVQLPTAATPNSTGFVLLTQSSVRIYFYFPWFSIRNAVRIQCTQQGASSSRLDTTLPVSSDTFDDTGLSPGTTYVYRISGVNNLRGEAPFATVTVTTLPPDDEDGDGLPDPWELQIVNFSTTDAVTTMFQVFPSADFDQDGWSNLDEFQRGTNPTVWNLRDDDNDGMSDPWEWTKIVSWNTGDPIVQISQVLPQDDFDGDGLTNLTEYTGNTDPTDSPWEMMSVPAPSFFYVPGQGLESYFTFRALVSMNDLGELIVADGNGRALIWRESARHLGWQELAQLGIMPTSGNGTGVLAKQNNRGLRVFWTDRKVVVVRPNGSVADLGALREAQIDQVTDSGFILGSYKEPVPSERRVYFRYREDTMDGGLTLPPMETVLLPEFSAIPSGASRRGELLAGFFGGEPGSYGPFHRTVTGSHYTSPVPGVRLMGIDGKLRDISAFGAYSYTTPLVGLRMNWAGDVVLGVHSPFSNALMPDGGVSTSAGAAAFVILASGETRPIPAPLQREGQEPRPLNATCISRNAEVGGFYMTGHGESQRSQGFIATSTGVVLDQQFNRFYSYSRDSYGVQTSQMNSTVLASNSVGWFAYGTAQTVEVDPDGDGITEPQTNTNYYLLIPRGDSDRDGLPDDWEVTHFGSIAAENGTGDRDLDGLSNRLEYIHDTSPTSIDTDEDNYEDLFEVDLGMDPLREDGQEDVDGDGKSWNLEFRDGTSPFHRPTSTGPQPPFFHDLEDQLGSIGDSVDVQLEATDPDSLGLVFSAENLPPGLTINANTGRITGTLTTEGFYLVDVTVSDGTLSETQSFYWIVTDFNEDWENSEFSSFTSSLPMTFAAANEPEESTQTEETLRRQQASQIESAFSPSVSYSATSAPSSNLASATSAEKGRAVKGRGTQSIQAGMARMVVLTITSQEYPYWTGQQSKYNDVVTWQVRASGSSKTYSGSRRVNALHTAFKQSGGVYTQVLGLVTAPSDTAISVKALVTSTNVADDLLSTTITVELRPVDLDVVHPATGEMSESRETNEGGLAAIRRDAGTPITKLKLHKLQGLQNAHFKLVFSSSKIKLWRQNDNGYLSKPIVTDSTTFPADRDTEVFVEGVTKSDAAKDVEVGLKVVVGSAQSSHAPIKLTVVEGEFDVQAKMWIREQWIDTPLLHPTIHFGGYKIAGGDDRDNNNSPTASYRVTQKVTIVPYKDLDSDGIKDDHVPFIYKINSPGLSSLWVKSASVPNPGDPYSTSNRFLSTATPSSTAPPDATRMHIDGLARTNDKVSRVRFHGAVNDPLVPFSLDINWDITVTIDGTDVLKPKYVVEGTHDDYPAFEIDLGDSIGRRSPQPYFWLHPLPSNVFDLAPGGSITIPATTKGDIR